MSISHKAQVQGVALKEDASADGAAPRYLLSGDPSLAGYYPAWLDNLADDVTVEGSMLDGAVRGAEAVRAIIGGIRSLYGDSQEFHFAGPWHGDVWVEDYIAQVRAKPLGCVVVVTRNAAGETQQIAASYRPRSSLLLFSRLLGEKFADAPYGKQFATSVD
jgi:hypothetical protein